MTAVVEGGAKVVGFDVVFPTSIEQSEIPFGDETLGAKLRGFDRDFLRALAAASQSGKIHKKNRCRRARDVNERPVSSIEIVPAGGTNAANYLERDRHILVL